MEICPRLTQCGTDWQWVPAAGLRLWAGSTLTGDGNSCPSPGGQVSEPGHRTATFGQAHGGVWTPARERVFAGAKVDDKNPWARAEPPYRNLNSVLIALQFALTEAFRWRRYQSRPANPEEIATVVDDDGSGTTTAAGTTVTIPPPFATV